VRGVEREPAGPRFFPRALALPPSVMHAHLLNILAVEVLRRPPGGRVLRILDVGSGDGRFIAYANAALPPIIGRPVEIHGVDVTDSAVQRAGFFAAALQRLDRADAGVDWRSRLHQITSDEPWPFPSESFDVVVSNQVGEHVHDLDFFFREGARVVRRGGFATHVFPLKQYILEGHTGAPFAHRFLSHDLRQMYLATFSRLGLSRFGPLRLAADETAAEFGRTRSDYVSFETRYRTWVEVATAATDAGWRSTYRYTTHLYLLKLGYLLGLDLRGLYRRPRPLVDMLLFRPLSRVSSVTVLLEREQDFRPDLNSFN
jgi:SAM-dependent methyltransferase